MKNTHFKIKVYVWDVEFNYVRYMYSGSSMTTENHKNSRELVLVEENSMKAVIEYLKDFLGEQCTIHECDINKATFLGISFLHIPYGGENI